MKEYDAILAHCYMFPHETGSKAVGLRNHLQDSAIALLYKSGQVHKVFIPGGKLWGDEAPSVAELMKDHLVRRGVRTEDIVIKPAAVDTTTEVDQFLEEAQAQGWQSLISMANATHARRVNQIIQKRNADIDVAKAEEILSLVYWQGKLPYQEFLDEFSASIAEKLFTVRELVVSALTWIGVEGLLQNLAKNSIMRRLKSLIDS